MKNWTLAVFIDKQICSLCSCSAICMLWFVCSYVLPAFNCHFLFGEGYPLHCYKQAGLTALSTLLNVTVPPAHNTLHRQKHQDMDQHPWDKLCRYRAFSWQTQHVIILMLNLGETMKVLSLCVAFLVKLLISLLQESNLPYRFLSVTVVWVCVCDSLLQLVSPWWRDYRLVCRLMSLCVCVCECVPAYASEVSQWLRVSYPLFQVCERVCAHYRVCSQRCSLAVKDCKASDPTVKNGRARPFPVHPADPRPLY